jgi:HEAT repeat protein
MCLRSLITLLVFCLASAGQDINSPDPQVRAQAAQELASRGSGAIPELTALLKDSEVEVRVEAVKSIVNIGTQHSLDPLVQALRDNDPEVQIRATDGLVNFYLPGYVKTGLTASIRRAGSAIKSRFTDTNDQIIPVSITPRPEIIEGLGKLARGGASMESRANAARAAGILRGKEAVPDLIEALRSKDDRVLYEVMIALQKIRDPSIAPRIAFLLRDLNEKVQVAAIETTGLLQNREALPDLRGVLERTSSKKVRRTALTAIAMLPDPGNRAIYAKYFEDRDEGMRTAAAEGYARIKDPADLEMIRKAFDAETKMPPRLAMAFALVSLGQTEVSEFSPLQYLVNTLNSRAYRGVVEAYLIELARDPQVREALYPALASGTRAERTGLAAVFARSGDESTIAHLERLSSDRDAEIATEGLRALQNLRARLHP